MITDDDDNNENDS